MANFGPLTAEIRSGVWGTAANFNGFRVLPSLLQRRRSPKANQTLHDIWPSPGLVQWAGIVSDALTPDRILPGAKFTLHPSHCTVLQQRALAKLCGVVQGVELRNFRRGHQLYSDGRPSRWVSAHILVFTYIFSFFSVDRPVNEAAAASGFHKPAKGNLNCFKLFSVGYGEYCIFSIFAYQ